MQKASTPDNLRSLRACLNCALIKSADQFVEEGCDNCPHLEIQKSTSMMHHCTTKNFYGTIAMMNPPKSWVSRFQGIKKLVGGVYAIKVRGELEDFTD